MSLTPPRTAEGKISQYTVLALTSETWSLNINRPVEVVKSQEAVAINPIQTIVR